MTGRRGLEPPPDLTLPAPGSTTARRILSLAIGRLAADLGPVLRAAPPALAGRAAAVAAEVRAAFAGDPGPLFSALRRPSVGTLVRCLRRPDLGSAAEREAWLGALLAHLGAHASAAALEPPSVPIAGGIALALADDNPLAMVEAHPDKQGNAVDLGGRSPAAWCAALAGALALIAEHLPELRGEMDLFVHRVVPVGWDAERHLSASYQEAIGTLYLSLHPSRVTLAEALLHELSHTKLNALFELDEVLENAWSPLYASPVRPDPRPLHGVLLAVHAFVPVACLYERMLAADCPESRTEPFRRRLAEVLAIGREGTAVLLASARPTPVGRALLDELGRRDASLGAPVPRTGSAPPG